MVNNNHIHVHVAFHLGQLFILYLDIIYFSSYGFSLSE